MAFDAGDDLSSQEQEYNPTPIINEVRTYVETWRNLPNPEQWLVTPETARLLKHWRGDGFQGVRPFFCQIEAVETAIWLTEVAPKMGARFGKFWDHLKDANAEANPELLRLALKLATGAGKTTVMAMIIAWQTVNAARHPSSKTFSRGFLVVAPGITIRDRLRVLQPNDPESYYRHREIVPPDMLGEIDKAKIVITNYHAFKLRERMEVAKGTRNAIEGWRGEKLQTLETEGQMLQRVMPELMGMKTIVVLNDEAHHCYRERVQDADGETEADLKGEDKDEAKENNEAARMWISGLEIVKRKLGISLVYDLSATPFFLRGSGYHEGTLFPWTMSDFSLMDAIECGIVKLPRVPVADNIPGGDAPKFRNLWETIGKKMPKKGRGAGGKALDPLEPAGRTLDGAGRALRPLREDLQPVARGEDRRSAGLHRRLQQHLDFGTHLQIHLRLPAQERRRNDHARERPPRAVPQFRRARQPVPAAEYDPDRQRPARIRRRARQGFPGDGGDGDRTVPPRDHRADPRRCRPARRSTMRRCCAR